MTDILDLPFDQYQRYELVHALLESVRGEGETFHVLDVGGRTALLRDFLPDDRVDLVDVEPSEAKGLVLGSGARLPFRDGAFDAVCGFDTLEHVPPPLREAFVAECARVSRRYVILAGPYDAPRVAEAERILLDFLQVRLGWEHRYLAEHRENELPDMDATRRGLEVAGAEVATFGHGALDLWLLLMSLELYIEHEVLLRDFAKRVYRFYNEHLFRTDHGPEVYRHAVVAAFDGARMPSLDGVLEPPGSAPAEAGRTLIDLGREILRYDALRDTYSPEMERLHGVVAAVEKDLFEHKSALGVVEQDLREHRATVEALRSEIKSERAAAQSMAAAKDEQIGGLSSDLAGHKSKLAELERLRADELEELEVRAERLESANRLLCDQNELIARAQSQLEAAIQRLDSKEELESKLQGEVARAITCTESGEERIAAMKDAHLSLDEEIALIVDGRNRLLAERDEARAALAQAREKIATLQGEARRPWNRLGRALTWRRLDSRVLDD